MQDPNLNNAQNIYKEADGARGALIGIIHFQLILSKVQCYLLFGVRKFRILFLLLELPETIRSFSNHKILSLSFKTSVFPSVHYKSSNSQTPTKTRIRN